MIKTKVVTDKDGVYVYQDTSYPNPHGKNSWDKQSVFIDKKTLEKINAKFHD